MFLVFLPAFFAAVSIALFLVAPFVFFFAIAAAISPIVIGVFSDASREPPEIDFFAMIFSVLLPRVLLFAFKRQTLAACNRSPRIAARMEISIRCGTSSLGVGI